MQIKIIGLLILLGFTQLTACGQKGDLYIPQDPAAETSTEESEEEAKTE